MMQTHPTQIALDNYRQTRSDIEISEHLKQCPICQQELLFLEQLAAEMSVELPKVSIPETVHQQLTKAAHRRANQIRRGQMKKRFVQISVAAATAAAAAVIILLLNYGGLRNGLTTNNTQVSRNTGSKEGPTPNVQQSEFTLAKDDINRDGRVDVLDVFTFAKQIEHGDKQQSAVEQQKLHRLAMTVVSVSEKGGR